MIFIVFMLKNKWFYPRIKQFLGLIRAKKVRFSLEMIG